MSDYATFVQDKFVAHTPSGITNGFSLPGSMFCHQSALTAWALRRGRVMKQQPSLIWEDNA